jgi:hypothetical protein
MYTCTGTAARFHYRRRRYRRRKCGRTGRSAVPLKTQRSELPNHNKKQQQQKQESLVCVTTMMDPYHHGSIVSIERYVGLIVVILWITEIGSNPFFSLVFNDQNEATCQTSIRPHLVFRIFHPTIITIVSSIEGVVVLIVWKIGRVGSNEKRLATLQRQSLDGEVSGVLPWPFQPAYVSFSVFLRR